MTSVNVLHVLFFVLSSLNVNAPWWSHSYAKYCFVFRLLVATTP